jgi:2-iminobutanoate/2-iminopropanoate deaminase
LDGGRKASCSVAAAWRHGRAIAPQDHCWRGSAPSPWRKLVKQAFPASHAVPISKAVRAGDFVFTSAYGPWLFDPEHVIFDENGHIVSDGADQQDMPFDEQVHRTFDYVKAALEVAGCTLDDVVNAECWLSDPRDFVTFNAIYKTYFKQDPPVRSIFPSQFMFSCKVEIKVVAYKPLPR